MNNWHPHTLQHCVDSDVLGWLTATLALGMLIWYLAIAKRWLESAQLAGPGGKKVWLWLVALFIVCAMAGYVALIIALWFPKVSVVWRLVFLAIQNVVCPVFWTLARKYKFHLYGAYQNIGQKLAANAVLKMNNDELAVHTRQVLAESLGRQIKMT